MFVFWVAQVLLVLRSTQRAGPVVVSVGIDFVSQHIAHTNPSDGCTLFKQFFIILSFFVF